MTYITDYPSLAQCCRHMTDSGGQRFMDDNHLETVFTRILDRGIDNLTGATLNRADRRLSILSPEQLVDAAFPAEVSMCEATIGQEASKVLDTLYEQA